MGIEAILAMERATMECHERGDSLAVYREAVAVDANEWGGNGLVGHSFCFLLPAKSDRECEF